MLYKSSEQMQILEMISWLLYNKEDIREEECYFDDYQIYDKLLI